MAYINGFKTSVKVSLLCLENEGLYLRIIKLRITILYIMHYLTHTASGVTLSPVNFFGKCEQMCNLLRF